MKVALLTYSTRPRGGVVHTLALAEALAEAGADVTVHAVGRAFFRPVDPRVTVRLAEPAPTDIADVEARILTSIAALAATVDPDEYDVVHAQDCISANAVPGSLRTVHHLDAFTSPVLAECHERAIVQPSAHVCVSNGVATELLSGWGIDATVIPNGVDAERFATTTPTARRDWRGLLGGDPLILTVGGIEPRKGSLDLVEATAALTWRRPGTRLVIAGGETLFDYRDYRAQFDARCARLGVQPVILGSVPDADLPALVAACDAFVLPSKKEGFGLAAMEALAARRPVVLSALPVFREVFGTAVRYGSGPLGLAAALDASIGTPLDPEPGAALAATHTWERSARAHLEFYEHVRGRLGRAREIPLETLTV